MGQQPARENMEPIGYKIPWQKYAAVVAVISAIASVIYGGVFAIGHYYEIRKEIEDNKNRLIIALDRIQDLENNNNAAFSFLNDVCDKLHKSSSHFIKYDDKVSNLNVVFAGVAMWDVELSAEKVRDKIKKGSKHPSIQKYIMELEEMVNNRYNMITPKNSHIIYDKNGFYLCNSELMSQINARSSKGSSAREKE